MVRAAERTTEAARRRGGCNWLRSKYSAKIGGLDHPFIVARQARRRATRLFNLPHHSPCRVKAIKRPKTTTRTQQAIDVPPARLARGGGVRLRFRFCTSRTVMNSKMKHVHPGKNNQRHLDPECSGHEILGGRL